MSNFIDNFKVKTNYAIEASAGTGKTYTIQNIVPKILDSGVTLDKILIVTYTDKATGELRDRIRKQLSKTSHSKNVDITNAPIYTIHSFCNNTIKEFGAELKCPMDIAQIDESQMDYFVEKFVRDGDIRLELKGLKREDTKATIETLQAALKLFYLNKSYNLDDNIISISKKDTYQNINEFEEAYPDVLDAIDGFKAIRDSGRYSGKDQDNIEAFCDALDVALDNVKNGKVFTYKETGRSFTRVMTVLKQNDDLFTPIFNAASEIKNRAIKILVSMYLPILYREWQEYKETNKYQTYDDMIRRVREEVYKNPTSPLLKKLKEKYTYAIIDEFQDTNQKQWDIFKSIFMGDSDHHIIVVGDPKQSIYSFQGADVDVYRKAVDEIVARGGTKISLDKNFRSRKEIVLACNKIFAPGDSFFKDKSILFQESDYNKNDKQECKVGIDSLKPVLITDKDVSPYEFAELATKKIIELTSFVNDKETKLQLTIEKKEKDLINKAGKEPEDKPKKYETRNANYSDFVILARARSEFKYFEACLKKYGIPFSKCKDTGLFSGLECSQWLAMLEAINANDLTGKNIHYFKRVLLTKFFGKTLYEINDEKYNTDKSEEIAKIFRWQEMAKNKLWEDLIDDILIESRFYSNLGGATSLDSINKFKQIGDALISYLTNNHNLLDAAEYLKTKLKNFNAESDDEDGDIVGKGTDFNSVKLMTIHASKGLEFPIVIMASGFKDIYTKGKACISKIDGKNYLDYKYADVEFAQKEWMRLFYVALTRASQLMILPTYEKKNATLNDNLESALRTFRDNNPNFVDYLIVPNNLDYNSLVEKTLSKTGSIVGNSIDTNDHLIKAKKGVKRNSLYKHSYSSLSHDKQEDIFIDDDYDLDKVRESELSLKDYDKKSVEISNLKYDSSKQYKPVSTFPKGSQIGTTLHEIFELYDYTNTDDDTLRNLITDRFKANGIKQEPDWIEDALKFTRHVLSAEIPEIKGKSITNKYFKLNEISNSNKKAEAEFDYLLLGDINEKLKDENNYFNGFIDLVFRRDKVYSVIDWKSDSLSDDFESYAEYDSLKGHVDDKYSIQRVLYAYVLINWLASKMGKTVEEVFKENFGGVYYVFIKGCYKDTSNGIYAHTWESYSDLEKAYKEVITRIWRKK